MPRNKRSNWMTTIIYSCWAVQLYEYILFEFGGLSHFQMNASECDIHENKREYKRWKKKKEISHNTDFTSLCRDLIWRLALADRSRSGPGWINSLFVYANRMICGSVVAWWWNTHIVFCVRAPSPSHIVIRLYQRDVHHFISLPFPRSCLTHKLLVCNTAELQWVFVVVFSTLCVPDVCWVRSSM